MTARKGAPTRRDRIIVLLGTLNDVRDPEQIDQETHHTTFQSKPLTFSDLYHAGSYSDLDRCLHRLRERAPKIHWHTMRVYVEKNRTTDTGRYLSARKANLGVAWLEKAMPPFVYVPTDILENEGFVVSSQARLKKAA